MSITALFSWTFVRQTKKQICKHNIQQALSSTASEPVTVWNKWTCFSRVSEKNNSRDMKTACNLMVNQYHQEADNINSNPKRKNRGSQPPLGHVNRVSRRWAMSWHAQQLVLITSKHTYITKKKTNNNIMKLDTIPQPHFTCQDIKKTQQFFKLKVSNQRLSHKHSYKINKRAPSSLMIIIT